MAREIDLDKANKVAIYINEHSEEYSIFKFTEELGLHDNIVEVGNNTFICCPFHDDNTPSFSIMNRNNIFKCFSCDESGSYVRFLTLYYEKVLHEKVYRGYILNKLLLKDKKMQLELGFSSLYISNKEKRNIRKVHTQFKISKDVSIGPENYIQLANIVNKQKDWGTFEKLHVMTLIQKGVSPQVIYKQVIDSKLFDMGKRKEMCMDLD